MKRFMVCVIGTLLIGRSMYADGTLPFIPFGDGTLPFYIAGTIEGENAPSPVDGTVTLELTEELSSFVMQPTHGAESGANCPSRLRWYPVPGKVAVHYQNQARETVYQIQGVCAPGLGQGARVVIAQQPGSRETLRMEGNLREVGRNQVFEGTATVRNSRNAIVRSFNYKLF